jgi:hypothetical protein
LDFFGLQIEPLLLLAIVLGAIGTLGTVLTVVSNTQQIWERFRAKSRRQDGEVKGIFQGLIPFFKSYDNGSMQNPWDFLRDFKASKDEILALDSTLKVRVANIERLLMELIDLLNPTPYFVYGIANPGPPDIVSNPNFKRLVSEVRKKMEKWLSEHA